MLRICAVSSPNANRLLAGSLLLLSLTLAAPSRAQGPAAADDPCAATGRRGPATGDSLLVLASCHEKAGRTASAWAEYLEAATLAHREKRPDLERTAKDHAASLGTHLSTLAVGVTPASNIPGLDVRRDGIPLDRAAWGTAAPVDPGEHQVDATAPGRLPWHRTIVVRPGGAQSVEVGPLEDTVDAVVGVTTLTSAAPPPDDTSSGAQDGPAPGSARRGGAQRAFGLTAVGMGLVGVGLGTYFGIRTLNQSEAARRACPTSPCADRAAIDKNDQAQTSSLLSTVSFAAGGGLVLLGSILFFSAPSASPPASAKPAPTRTFDVAATPAFSGVRWGGEF